MSAVAEEQAFWCHQCNHTVSAPAANPACPRCGGGFVEAIETSNRPNPLALPVDGEDRGQFLLALLQRLVAGEDEDLLMRALRPPEPPRASREAVDSLSKVLVTPELQEAHGECPVCMDAFALDTECVLMPCKHLFHTTCLTEWLSNHTTCPLCRHELPSESTPPPAAHVLHRSGRFSFPELDHDHDHEARLRVPRLSRAHYRPPPHHAGANGLPTTPRPHTPPLEMPHRLSRHSARRSGPSHHPIHMPLHHSPPSPPPPGFAPPVPVPASASASRPASASASASRPVPASASASRPASASASALGPDSRAYSSVGPLRRRSRPALPRSSPPTRPRLAVVAPPRSSSPPPRRSSREGAFSFLSRVFR